MNRPDLDALGTIANEYGHLSWWNVNDIIAYARELEDALRPLADAYGKRGTLIGSLDERLQTVKIILEGK